MFLVYDLDDVKNYIIFFIVYFLSTKCKSILIVNIEGEYVAIVGEEYWVFDDDKSGNPYSRGEVVWSYDEWSALGTNQYTPPNLC